MTTTKAYSYLRISNDQQKVGDGIRRQMEASKTYADQHGYDLVETMSDIGISAFKGKNITEGALGVFIAAIDAGNIEAGSVLLVESLDRLSRDSVLKAFNQFTSILQKDIGIVTLIDSQHYTAESVSENIGQLFTSLGVMVRANEESVIKSKRISAAWQRKREDIGDRKLTRNVPAWLKMSADRQEIQIIEVKAATVRLIYNWSVDGQGLFTITRHLNENIDKYPPITTAKKWNQSFVAKILKNPAVYGMFQPHSRVNGKQEAVGNPIEDYFPAIISQDTFNLAQSRAKGRSVKGAGRKGEAFTNLFTGLIKCGTCGGSCLLRSKYSKAKGGYKYLRCTNSLEKAGCTAPAWRYDELEAAFVRFVREIKFADVFLGSDSGSKIMKLEAHKATAITKKTELHEKYNALASQFETELPETLKVKLVERSLQLDAEIEAQLKNIADIELAMTELFSEDFEKDQADFLSSYEALEKTQDAVKLREIRYKMHGLLRRVVDTIVVHNNFDIYPWEVTDVISNKLRKQVLDKAKIKTEAELETYFSKLHGKRAYAKSERYMIIRFRNGTVRVVQPYTNQTFLSVTEKLVKLRANV
jgi:DNA invertase Pin-like site-specific DNA recombinase